MTPRKSLGQNFLVEPGAPARIVEQAGLDAGATVLEVGAGLGTLTAALAKRASSVIAVETDPHFLPILEQVLSPFDNVRIVPGDILKLNPTDLLGVQSSASSLWGTLLPHYYVVANLPYYITAAVMRHLLEAPVRPARMTLTMQREVAMRITAAPGDMSLLAVAVQFYGKPRIGLRLKRGAFYPPPQVESAVVCLDLYAEPPIPVSDVARFFETVRAGFSQRRKQLHNTLSSGLNLPGAAITAALAAKGIDSTRRAETLTLAEWGLVTDALA
ncbi:MAG: ribosomal RNA small subunit methyltransferase A [Anaerolineae bacterium]|nr:ribosomal RNA small subunit methyltransferase A [Anaerolineae bacterium]